MAYFLYTILSKPRDNFKKRKEADSRARAIPLVFPTALANCGFKADLKSVAFMIMKS